jgi:hypothetical protein
MNKHDEHLDWYRVADVDELPAGRVKTVTAGALSLARDLGQCGGWRRKVRPGLLASCRALAGSD